MDASFVAGRKFLSHSERQTLNYHRNKAFSRHYLTDINEIQLRKINFVDEGYVPLPYLNSSFLIDDDIDIEVRQITKTSAFAPLIHDACTPL